MVMCRVKWIAALGSTRHVSYFDQVLWHSEGSANLSLNVNTLLSSHTSVLKTTCERTPAPLMIRRRHTHKNKGYDVGQRDNTEALQAGTEQPSGLSSWYQAQIQVLSFLLGSAKAVMLILVPEEVVQVVISIECQTLWGAERCYWACC